MNDAEGRASVGQAGRLAGVVEHHPQVHRGQPVRGDTHRYGEPNRSGSALSASSVLRCR